MTPQAWLKTPLFLFVIPFAISALLELGTPFFSPFFFIQTGLGLSLVFSLVFKMFGETPSNAAGFWLALLFFELFFSIVLLLRVVGDRWLYIFLIGTLLASAVSWKKRAELLEMKGLWVQFPFWQVVLVENLTRAFFTSILIWGWSFL